MVVNSSQPEDDIMDMYEDVDDHIPAENAVQTAQEHSYEPVSAPNAIGTKRKAQSAPEEDEAVYGASRFGHFGEYMRRKRAKLQIQNASMDTEASADGKSNILKGISVYVRSCVFANMNACRRGLGSGERLDETVGTRHPETCRSAWRRLPTVPRQEVDRVRVAYRIAGFMYMTLSQDPRRDVFAHCSQGQRIQEYEGGQTRMAIGQHRFWISSSLDELHFSARR